MQKKKLCLLSIFIYVRLFICAFLLQDSSKQINCKLSKQKVFHLKFFNAYKKLWF